MQPYVNTEKVLSTNQHAITLATHEFTIGRSRIVLEAFIDHYFTHNVRVGVNGATPRFGWWGEQALKTNGLGWKKLREETDKFLDRVAHSHPIIGCDQLNEFGFPISLNPRLDANL